MAWLNPSMAKKTARKPGPKKPGMIRRLSMWLRRWVRRVILGGVVLVLVLLFALKFINPPTTYTIWSETRRLGEVDRQWFPIEEIAPHAVRSIVAAEDANFCLHWGFDMAAIRTALEDGGARGASTLSQQTVKNVFLWQGRSWPRKAMEAVLTPMSELMWSKRRILELYMNIAEFDEGVFGIDAASHHYFDTSPSKLSRTQAARLAMVLPNPKGRSASKPTANQRKRAERIADGAATIKADGRSACFED